MPSDIPSPKVTAIQFSVVVAFQAHPPFTLVWKLPPSRVTTCDAGAIVRSHEAADEEVGVLTLPLQADASDSAHASMTRRAFPFMYRETSRSAGSNSDGAGQTSGQTKGQTKGQTWGQTKGRT